LKLLQEEARLQREADRQAQTLYLEQVRAEARMERDVILEQMKTERLLLLEQLRLMSDEEVRASFVFVSYDSTHLHHQATLN
jgi:hypothetical protein